MQKISSTISDIEVLKKTFQTTDFQNKQKNETVQMPVDDPLGNPDADSGEEDSDFMPEKC